MCKKRKKNKKKKKTKKLSQFLKSHISGTLEAISLKFGMWSTEGGGSVHSKNGLVSSRQHRATEVRKLRFLSSCQYTHGCYVPASWAVQHTTVCLDIYLCNTFTPHTSDQRKASAYISHIALTQNVNEIYALPNSAYISLNTALMHTAAVSISLQARYISLSQCTYLINSRHCTPNRSAHYIQKSLDFFDVILYLSFHI